MSLLEKLIVLGNIAKDLDEFVIRADEKGVLIRIDPFEELSAGVKDFEYEWFGNCMKKSFIKDGIRIFATYNGKEMYDVKLIAEKSRSDKN